MAFQQLTTSATQTAVNAAALVASVQGVEFFDEIFEKAQSALLEAVEADNATLAREREAEAASPAPAKSSGGSRGRKTSGRAGKTNGRVKNYSLAEAEAFVLNKGAFEGVTLGELADMDVATAEDDYGYGNGERSGADYISWLISDDYSYEPVKAPARVVAADRGIE